MGPDHPTQPRSQITRTTELSPPSHADPSGREQMGPFSVARRRAACGVKAPQVLLAEDDPEMRTVLRSKLTKCGYAVTECVDGLDLLNHLGSFLIHRDDIPSEREDFDVIISDIRMPGASGLEILDGVARSCRLPPVILITAFGDKRTHDEAKRLGAVAVLDKPFDLNDLLATLADVVPAVASS